MSIKPDASMTDAVRKVAERQIRRLDENSLGDACSYPELRGKVIDRFVSAYDLFVFFTDGTWACFEYDDDWGTTRLHLAYFLPGARKLYGAGLLTDEEKKEQNKLVEQDCLKLDEEDEKRKLAELIQKYGVPKGSE